MGAVIPDVADELEALIQFLYLAPVGLAQTSMDGEITMINPISAQLLMPLARDGSLSNLFTALESVAPDLRHLTAGFDQAHGMVCAALRIQLDAGTPGRKDPTVLSLSLLELDENRLMAVLSDVTVEARRERLLEQNEAWFNAIFTGITDYALMSLDGRGHVDEWNASIGRVTGFAREAVLRQPYSIFYPSDACTPDRVLDRLREADENSWRRGWRQDPVDPERRRRDHGRRHRRPRRADEARRPGVACRQGGGPQPHRVLVHARSLRRLLIATR